MSKSNERRDRAVNKIKMNGSKLGWQISFGCDDELVREEIRTTVLILCQSNAGEFACGKINASPQVRMAVGRLATTNEHWR
jgi:hypothetical protein